MFDLELEHLMGLDSLTPEERARQEVAMGRLRQQIFSSGSFAALGIDQYVEHIVPGYAEQRWCAGKGGYRVRRWGGLAFEFSIQGASFRLAVTHAERNIFWIHIANERGQTESIARAAFKALGPFVWKQVTSCVNAHRESLERARVRAKRDA